MPGVSDEKSINRNLAISTSALAVTTVDIFVPLAVAVALPLLGASSWPVIVNSLNLIRKREREGVAILDLFPSMIVVFTTNYLAGASALAQAGATGGILPQAIEQIRTPGESASADEHTHRP